MKNQTEFEKRIVKALNQGVDHIVPATGRMQQIKNRYCVQKKESIEIMGRVTEFFKDLKFRINKPAATFCSIAVIAIMLCTFVQPVKVWAQEGIDKVMEMIYTVVKNEEGNYEAVQVPDNSDPSYSIQQEVTDGAVNFAFEAPPALENGYELISTHIQVDLTAEGKVIENVPDFIEKCYSKDQSDCTMFLTCSSKDDMYVYAQDKTYDGDTRKNRKEYTINKIPVYYYEDAIPEYPLVIDPKDGRWTNDLTQEPTIKTTHIFVWALDGVCYDLSDLGNSTFDKVKGDAEFIIQYQLKK